MKLNIETNRGWIDTVFCSSFKPEKNLQQQHLPNISLDLCFTRPSSSALRALLRSRYPIIGHCPAAFRRPGSWPHPSWTTHLSNTMCPGPVEFGFYMFLRFLASLILRLCVLKCFHHQILELTYNVTRVVSVVPLHHSVAALVCHQSTILHRRAGPGAQRGRCLSSPLLR